MREHVSWVKPPLIWIVMSHCHQQQQALSHCAWPSKLIEDIWLDMHHMSQLPHNLLSFFGISSLPSLTLSPLFLLSFSLKSKILKIWYLSHLWLYLHLFTLQQVKLLPFVLIVEIECGHLIGYFNDTVEHYLNWR